MGDGYTRVTDRDLVNALLGTDKLRGSIPTVYHYDSDFQVVRFDWPNNSHAKQVRPIHREGEFWVMGDPKGGKLPLYHVNDLRKADTVYVSEGEKTTDILRVLGLDATTSSHGSGSAGRSDWTPLAGKNVVILPDAGTTGAVYGKAVVSLLGTLIPVPTIRVVALPGLADGEDVEQWLASLSDGVDAVEALVEMTEQVAVNRPPRAKPGGPLTEMWLAERFVDEHGDDVRHSRAIGWYVWDGCRWAVDDTGEIHRRIKLTVRNLYRAAADEDDPSMRHALVKFAQTCERHARVVATTSLAASELPVPVRIGDLDAYPWLLGTPKGTVDLQTGKMRENRRTDLLTKSTAFGPDMAGTAPRWTAFLEDIFAGDDDLIGFVQRALGSMLAGTIREHVLHILFGKGANGKTTLVEVVKTILGDYAMVAAPRLLMLKHDSHPAELADLRGMRLVACVESGEGRRLDEERVKQLCGGDTIKARMLYHDFFEFTPTHTLLLATNHKPEIKGQDLAIWRRIRLWPFEVTVEPERQDLELKDKLLLEGSAILGWLVRGCLDWQECGLDEPQAVSASTQDYRADQDIVQWFINEYCIVDPMERVLVGDLYKVYIEWAGEKQTSRRRFGDRLRDRGYENVRGSKGKHYWIGLKLIEDDTLLGMA